MRWARYGLVMVLAVELALWEVFLVSARPFGTTFPVSAVLAVVGNVALGRAGARVLGTPQGAFGPSLAWLGVAVTFSLPETSSYAVVPGTGRGVLFLVAGMVTAVALPLALSGRKPAVHDTNGASGATPGGHLGR